MIYIKRYDYSNISRGERKKEETLNGRKLLKFAVQDLFGLNTDTLVITKNEHGKPYFQDVRGIEFNISHSGDYVAVMLGDTHIGVDIQTVRPVKERVIYKMCNDDECSFVFSDTETDRAFIRLWTLKESYVKALGTGMTFPMSTVNFDLRNTEEDTGKFGKLSNQQGIFLNRDFDDFILSACVLNEDIPKEHLEQIFEIKILDNFYNIS